MTGPDHDADIRYCCLEHLAALPHLHNIFEAGRAEEREQIRAKLLALHMTVTTRGRGLMPGWHIFTHLLDGDDE